MCVHKISKQYTKSSTWQEFARFNHIYISLTINIVGFVEYNESIQLFNCDGLNAFKHKLLCVIQY